VDHDDRMADTGMLGSKTENPGPDRDTRLTGTPTRPPQPVLVTR
jgi:hypothetical protein